jgi:hypothetical protein
MGKCFEKVISSMNFALVYINSATLLHLSLPRFWNHSRGTQLFFVHAADSPSLEHLQMLQSLWKVLPGWHVPVFPSPAMLAHRKKTGAKTVHIHVHVWVCVCVCMYVYMPVCVCVRACVCACKGCTKIHPALALRPPRFIVLPLPIHPSVKPILLTKCRGFLMGQVIVVTWFHETVAEVKLAAASELHMMFMPNSSFCRHLS